MFSYTDFLNPFNRYSPPENKEDPASEFPGIFAFPPMDAVVYDAVMTSLAMVMPPLKFPPLNYDLPILKETLNYDSPILEETLYYDLPILEETLKPEESKRIQEATTRNISPDSWLTLLARKLNKTSIDRAEVMEIWNMNPEYQYFLAGENIYYRARNYSLPMETIVYHFTLANRLHFKEIACFIYCSNPSQLASIIAKKNPTEQTTILNKVLENGLSTNYSEPDLFITTYLAQFNSENIYILESCLDKVNRSRPSELKYLKINILENKISFINEISAEPSKVSVAAIEKPVLSTDDWIESVLDTAQPELPLASPLRLERSRSLSSSWFDNLPSLADLGTFAVSPSRELSNPEEPASKRAKKQP